MTWFAGAEDRDLVTPPVELDTRHAGITRPVDDVVDQGAPGEQPGVALTLVFG